MAIIVIVAHYLNSYKSFNLTMALIWWEKIFLVIIAVVSLRIFIKIGILVWKKLVAPSLGLGIDIRTQGRWAVVTGATDGLGKAFAKAFAEKGLDIVLISRSMSKLKDVAAEIEREYRVETRVIEADLTEGQVVYAEIAKVTQDLEVGVLVNNAGASYDHPELFTNVSEEVLAKILQLNVAGVTGVARAVLPGMMERRKGVLINVSSTAAAIPSPYLAVYAASKAYIDKLSADLATEAAPRGVTVQCILPGPVATKMSKIKRPTWMAPTPEKFVEATLRTVGIESRTTGYPPHSLIIGVINTLRFTCETGAVWLVTKTMLNIRGRALRKKTKSQEDAQGDILTNNKMS
ncbi:very-long-chain 3-oxoacyl-CoA reductase-like isoform X1 [Formica exsecta]|uniref:very-long-chain 3-oxoacyl-CoA reductase-like isoform X1 n=2 Tax=Formica exsecta TaxID=72781 RepID=UPI001141BAD9|nr:very-long-chain 3-oxoacyl-CoA reductase-like isoform X1 [Formica exsecta]